MEECFWCGTKDKLINEYIVTVCEECLTNLKE
jgi:hypothetical protein